MLPENELSSTPVAGDFIGTAAVVFPDVLARADGGIALNDPSMGLDYQVWDAEVVKNIDNDQIVLSAPSVSPIVVYTGDDITAVSLAFDTLMQYTISFVEAGESKIKFYDSSIGDFTVYSVGATSSNPKIALDETRLFNSANSDILMAYIKDEKLYYRQQRDRYTIERKLSDGPWINLVRIGRMDNLRFGFQVVAP